MPTTAFWNLHQEINMFVSPLPTAWDLLKASVANAEHYTEAFAFRIFMKAWSIEGARTTPPLFYTSMKLKLIKHIPVQEHEEE